MSVSTRVPPGFGKVLAYGAVLLVAALGAAAPAAAQDDARVGFSARLEPDTIYVGQQATYALTVRIPSVVRQRLRRNPEFVPPEARGMLAYELPLSRLGDRSSDAEVHMFRRALFVLSPGRYTIAPARLTYAVPQSTSFFSREEEQVLRSAGVTVVAIDPPARGRPAEWMGAVGSWRAAARVEPADPRVGDPVVLTLRLEGEGNPTLLPRPMLRVSWADVVADDERVELVAEQAVLGGSKEFTWLLTPREDGRQVVPSIEYPFFDPVARGYAVARSSAVPLQVRPGSIVSLPPRTRATRDTLPLPLRASVGRSTWLGLQASWWMWLLAAALAPIPLMWSSWRPRRRRDAVVRDEPPPTPRTQLDAAIRARTGLDVGSFTAPGTLAAALRLEGVTSATADEAERLRDALDRGSFAEDATDQGSDLRARATALARQIEAEARARVLLLALMLASLVGCSVSRDIPADVLGSFTDGRTAYRGQDYARAALAFRIVASATPQDPDAWANLGAAAWQAGDTAAAVVGWQRALRLDPQDPEPRELLTRVRAPQHRGAARVWPVPPSWVLLAALGLWWSGWLWAWRRRRHGLHLRPAWGVVGLSLGCALAAAWMDRGLAARSLVVIAQPTSLRALPALGADPGAQPLAGEIAAVLERRGVWLRIELDGGRSGWYPAERVISLARD